MTEVTLERLAEGIKKANEAGNTEKVKKLGRAFRDLQAQKEQSAQSTGGNSSVRDAAVFGVDQAGKLLGQGVQGIGELTGLEGLENYGREWAESNKEDIERRGYERPEGADGIVKNIREGDFVDAAKSLGYGAIETGPSVGAGAVASVGAAGATLGSGAIAAGGAALAGGGTLYGILSALGENRSEAEEQGLDPEATLQDLGAAVASGIVELVPASKGAGYVLKFGREAAQEAIQEGIVVGNTAVKGGEYVPAEVAERLADAGITGGVVSSGSETVVRGAASATQKAVDSATNIRTDKNVDSIDREVAEKLVSRAGANPERLADVRTTDSSTSAQGVAKGVQTEIRKALQVDAQDLRKLAKARGNKDDVKIINSIVGVTGNHKSGYSEAEIQILEDRYGDTKEGAEFVSLARQASRIEQFTGGGDDMGGASQFSRYFDFTDGRNTGITKAAALFGNAGLVGAGIAINRSARVFDNITNKRSKVKRYVDSVRKENPPKQQIPSTSVDALLEQMKAEKKARDFSNKASKKTVQRLVSPGKIQKKGWRGNKPVDQAELDSIAGRMTPEARAFAPIFEEGATVPQNDPMYEGYRRWENRTGLSPLDTLETLEQLEREGQVPKNTAQRYREDIGSFSGKTNRNKTIAIQELVRQRANPDHQYDPTVSDEDVSLKRLSMQDQKVPGDRRKEKAVKGAVHRRNLDDAIQKAGPGLSTDQLIKLKTLAEEIDSPGVTRAERFKRVNKVLGNVFRGQPQMADLWRRQFSDLAAIGNDKPIYQETEQETNPEEQAFEKKRSEAEKAAQKKSKKPSRKRSAEELAESQREVPDPQKTTEEPKGKDLILKHDVPRLDRSTTANRQEAEQIKLPKRREGRYGRNSVSDMVLNRVNQIQTAKLIADNHEQELSDYMSSLGKGAEDRVVGLMIGAASDQTTQNMISEAYADRFGVPYADAARIVNDVMSSLEAKGKIKRYKMWGNDALKVEGKYKQDSEGRGLKVVSFDIIDPSMKEMLSISKSVAMRDKIVDPSGPSVMYEPGVTTDGVHKAFKSYTDAEADDSFMPMYNFLNPLREMKLKYNDKMLRQMEGALEDKGNRQVGMIGEVLNPTVDTKLQKDRNSGKWKEVPVKDQTNINTLGQIIAAHGGADERVDTRFRQEWTSDKNLRVYPKNGLAHTQAGDMMKGLTRMPESRPLGNAKALDDVFHTIGNLLGFDKEAPAVRRQAALRPGVAKNLIKFAEDPFGQSKVYRQGKPTKIGKIVDDGEGFFQVLNAAHEIKDMVDFATERFPDKAGLDPSKLLQDPEVRADLAQNYSTDFVVQLDASNNAYQLMGLVTGDAKILQATGMQPQQGIKNPDTQKGADIYLDPAREIAARIPELVELNLPEQKLRKLFKKPIGTLLYETTHNSRKEAFRKELGDIAGKAPIFKLEGETDGLITVPQQVADAMETSEGFTFDKTSYDENGAEKGQSKVRKRIVRTEDGRYQIESATPKGQWRPGAKFADKETGIKEAYESQFYTRMDSELLRDMNTRYPEIRNYLRFADSVTRIVKDRGGDHVKIPTPDGMMLKSRIKENTQYQAVDVQLGDKTVPMGVKTDESKPSGRGVAAAMMHQLDAYVLRETFKRMREQGLLEEGFNPIHDSYGFHPSESQAGREVWSEVMQELGSEDYNLFHQILEANEIDLPTLKQNKGVIPNRNGVTPVSPDQIPTALS